MHACEICSFHRSKDVNIVVMGCNGMWTHRQIQFQINILSQSSALQMETVGFSETLASSCMFTQCHNPEHQDEKCKDSHKKRKLVIYFARIYLMELHKKSVLFTKYYWGRQIK